MVECIRFIPWFVIFPFFARGIERWVYFGHRDCCNCIIQQIPYSGVSEPLFAFNPCLWGISDPRQDGHYQCVDPGFFPLAQIISSIVVLFFVQLKSASCQYPCGHFFRGKRYVSLPLDAQVAIVYFLTDRLASLESVAHQLIYKAFRIQHHRRQGRL